MFSEIKSSIKEATDKVLGLLPDSVSKKIRAMGSFVEEKFTDLKNTVNAKVEEFVTSIPAKVKKFTEGLGKTIDKIFDGIVKLVDEGPGGIFKKAKGLAGRAASGAKSIFSRFTRAVGLSSEPKALKDAAKKTQEAEKKQTKVLEEVRDAVKASGQASFGPQMIPIGAGAGGSVNALDRVDDAALTFIQLGEFE
jgi:hypothetical protein